MGVNGPTYSGLQGLLGYIQALMYLVQVDDARSLVSRRALSTTSNTSHKLLKFPSEIVNEPNAEIHQEFKTPDQILSELLCAPYNLKLVPHEEDAFRGEHKLLDADLRADMSIALNLGRDFNVTCIMAARQAIPATEWATVRRQYPPVVDLLL